MKNSNKLFIINMLTVLAAFAVLMCLFAMQGISVISVFALMGAAFFADVTVSLAKTETLLRRKMRRKTVKLTTYKNNYTTAA